MRSWRSRGEHAIARAPGWWPGVAAAAIVVALPAVCAGVAIAGGWVPSNDWAVVVARSVDTFSANPPLIGQWTSLSRYAGTELHQPGPLQFWFLAVPTHLFAPSPAGALVGSAILAMAALSTALVAAWRRGGVRILAAMAVVLAILVHSIGPWLIRDPYNPGAALVGLIAFLASAWSIVDDDPWFWPALVFFGTMSAQTHVTYVIPMAAVGLVIAGHLVIRRRRRRRGAGRRSSNWGPLIASVVVGLAVWSGPIIDQVHGTGNFSALVSAGSGGVRSLGPRFGLDRLVEQLAIPPLWLHDVHVVAPAGPSGVAAVSALVTATLLGLAVARAWRQRSQVRLALAAVVIAALIGGVVASARIPAEPLAATATNNRLFWWPIAAMTWFFLGWFVVDVGAALIGRRFHVGASPRMDRVVAIVALVVVCGAGVAMAPTMHPSHDPVSLTFAEVDRFSDVAARACTRHHGPVAVTGDAAADVGSLPGVVAMLRLSACDVHTTNVAYFGHERAVTGRESLEFRITSSPEAPAGFRRVATADPRHRPARYQDFNTAGYFAYPRTSYLYQRGS